MFVANQKRINRNPVGVACITHLHWNSFSYLLGQIPSVFLRSLFCCSHCSYQHITPTGFRFCCFCCSVKHTTPARVYGIRVLKQVSFLYYSLCNLRYYYTEYIELDFIVQCFYIHFKEEIIQPSALSLSPIRKRPIPRVFLGRENEQRHPEHIDGLKSTIPNPFK